jgi:hypothetical protein
MKRCPQCLFIYPDADSRCDFDNTPLVVVNEAELEAATSEAPAPVKAKKRAPRKRKSKVTAILVVIGLLLGVGTFLVYYSFAQANQDTPEIAPVAIAAPAPIAAPLPAVASGSPVETPSPSPAPSATPKSAAERVATSHTSTTSSPVSTSGPGVGKKAGGKPVILLTTGGRIEADEVWRTRDGIWYRRAGIVTLLKRNTVKAIVER